MLTQDEQKQIRDTVRDGLEHILGDHGAPNASVGQARELERLTEAKLIIAEETERYYTQMGLVKHLTRDGQVVWVTPAEKDKLTQRRRRRGRTSWMPKIPFRIAMVWVVTLLVAVLLISYLLNSGLITGLTPVG